MDLAHYFDQAVDDLFDKADLSKLPFDKTDLKNFIKRHERKPVVLANLQVELNKTANIAVKHDIFLFKRMVEGVAHMFVRTAIESHHHKVVSLNERRRREDENRAKAEIERVATEEGFFVKDKEDSE